MATWFIVLMTILGVPFALTLIAVNVIGFYTAKLFSLFWVGNHFGPYIGLKPNRVWTLIVSLICYFLLTAIPFIGTCIAFIAMLFGLGASIVGKLFPRVQQ